MANYTPQWELLEKYRAPFFNYLLITLLGALCLFFILVGLSSHWMAYIIIPVIIFIIAWYQNIYRYKSTKSFLERNDIKFFDRDGLSDFGLICVMTYDDKVGVSKKKSNVFVIEPRYSQIIRNKTYLFVKDDQGCYGVFNMKTLQPIIPFKYQSITITSDDKVCCFGFDNSRDYYTSNGRLLASFS